MAQMETRMGKATKNFEEQDIIIPAVSVVSCRSKARAAYSFHPLSASGRKASMSNTRSILAARGTDN